MPESLDAVGEARLFGGRPLRTRRGLWSEPGHSEKGGSVGRARRALSGNRVWGAPCTWSHSKSGSTLSNVLKGRGPAVWWTQAPLPPPPRCCRPASPPPPPNPLAFSCPYLLKLSQRMAVPSSYLVGTWGLWGNILAAVACGHSGSSLVEKQPCFPSYSPGCPPFLSMTPAGRPQICAACTRMWKEAEGRSPFAFTHPWHLLTVSSCSWGPCLPAAVFALAGGMP